MTTRQLRYALLLVLIAAVSACGGDEGNSDSTGAGGDGGSDQVVSSGQVGGEDLGDFPIPGPTVGNAALTSDSEEFKVYTITFPAGDFDDVIAFYDDWTGSQSDEYQRVEAESGGVSWTLVSGDEGRARIIAASPALAGEDLAFVTLTDATTE